MSKLHRRLLLILIAAVSSLLAASTAYAQSDQPGTPTDDDVNRVAKQLYCPVCPNTPLDVCQTKACEDWRAQIRDELAEGWTDQQIIDYFVAQYGERVLAEPQRRGFTSFVWLLPVLAVLLGIGVVYEILKGWRTRKSAAAPASAVVDIPDEIREKIERELRELV